MTEAEQKVIEDCAKELDEIFVSADSICGNCKSLRQGEKNGSCCINCASNEGFFRMEYWEGLEKIAKIKQDKLDKLKKEYNFSEEKGFLGEKGCMLPRSKRSIDCLQHVCDKLLLKISNEKESGFYTIRKRINLLTNTIERIKKKNQELN